MNLKLVWERRAGKLMECGTVCALIFDNASNLPTTSLSLRKQIQEVLLEVDLHELLELKMQG